MSKIIYDTLDDCEEITVTERLSEEVVEIPHEELIDVIPFEEGIDDKSQIVLIETFDKNNKTHYVACEDMETAKSLYPNAQKNYIPLIRSNSVEESIENFDDFENNKGVCDFLKTLSYNDIIKLPYSSEEITYRHNDIEVSIWTHESAFGPAWTPKPVISIQVDMDSRPNGYIGVNDIESEEEFNSAVSRICKRIKKDTDESAE